MARIALAVGFAALGALTGGISFAFSIAAIVQGAAIGLAAGQLLGSLFLPPHTSSSGPRLQDGQVSSSANGSPRPFGYGGFMLGAQIIWSSGIQENKTTTTQSAKGGPTNTSTTYSYTVSFAGAFCEGPAKITRIWGDSKLIFDSTKKGSTTSPKLSTGIGTNTIVLYPTIYPGSSTQNPDPTIQAAEGVNGTPAFRGTCYLVYENFPLADFGNRLPNIRAEISTGAVDAFLKDIFPPSNVIDPNFTATPEFSRPSWCFIDQVNRAAYVYDAIGFVIQRIDLNVDSRSPLEAWQAATAYVIGDQILGSNNSVQVVTSTTSDGETGSVEPTWTDVLFDQITDHHVQWQNVGEGPDSVAITNQGAVNPDMGRGETITGVNSMPYGAGVDTAGYLWLSVNLDPAWDVIDAFHWQAQRYDPRTFNAVGAVRLNAAAQSFQFQRTTAGKDLIVITTATNFGQPGGVYFVDAKKLDAPFGAKYYLDTVASGVAPIALDSSSRAYIVMHGTGFAYTVSIADPRSGAVTTRIVSFTSDATVGNPRSILWNESDDSLLLFTDNGYIIKIDVGSMTVSAITASAVFYNGGNYPDKFSSMYPAGQVPSDGIVRASVQISGVDKIAFINAVTLAVESNVDLSDWIAGDAGPLLHHSYDAPSNSIVTTITGTVNLSFRLYLDRQAVAGETLDLVVLDLLERGGLSSSDVDVSALGSITVLGYPLARNPDVKGALAPLTQAYLFDLIESDFKIKAVLRGGNASFSIPESDLGLIGDQFEVQPNFAQEQDLPKTLEITYSDPELDYEQGKQQRQRNARVKKTKQKISLQLPLTLEADAAANIAERALRTLWDERDSYAFKLWRASYLALDPCDVGEFVYNGDTYVARLVKTTMGQDLTLEIAAVSEDARNYNSAVNSAPALGFVPSIVNPAPPTLLFLLDLPLLQDIDSSPPGATGYYYAMAAVGVGWPAGVLYSSVDGATWNQIGFSRDSIIFGSVSVPIGSPVNPWTWDTVNELTVFLARGTLSSISDLNVLNGANAAIYGDEIIQFANATLNADGSYTLSRLLRGRRGTEHTTSDHVAGELFISLAGGLHRNTLPTSQIGISSSYRAVTVGGLTAGAQTNELTPAGNDLKPYSPVHIRGARDGSNNLTITWFRRTRIGGGLMDGTGTVPLAEDSEAYSVEILDGMGVVKRTISGLSSPTAGYTAAQQTADFGSVQSAIAVKVYQLSAQVGRGFPGSNTV